MSIITKNTTIENFHRKIKNQRTREIYTRSLDEFMKFVKILDYEVLVGEDYSTITEQLKNWISDLNKKGLKKGTISTKIRAVELFLEMNESSWAKSIIRKMLSERKEIPVRKRSVTDEGVFEKDFSLTEEIEDNNLEGFFPMICEECGKSFGKDVVKLAVHSSSHYPPRITKQLPTRYRHRKKY